MSTAAQTGVYLSNVDADTWEPVLANGEPTGADRIPLRTRGSAGVLRAGIWRRSETTAAAPYVIPGDETFIVLEGVVDIVFDGETMRLGVGDMASFTTGQETTWQIVEAPFRKFFVVTEPDA